MEKLRIEPQGMLQALLGSAACPADGGWMDTQLSGDARIGLLLVVMHQDDRSLPVCQLGRNGSAQRFLKDRNALPVVRRQPEHLPVQLQTQIPFVLSLALRQWAPLRDAHAGLR